MNLPPSTHPPTAVMHAETTADGVDASTDRSVAAAAAGAAAAAATAAVGGVRHPGLALAPTDSSPHQLNHHAKSSLLQVHAFLHSFADVLSLAHCANEDGSCAIASRIGPPSLDQLSLVEMEAAFAHGDLPPVHRVHKLLLGFMAQETLASPAGGGQPSAGGGGGGGGGV